MLVEETNNSSSYSKSNEVIIFLNACFHMTIFINYLYKRCAFAGHEKIRNEYRNSKRIHHIKQVLNSHHSTNQKEVHIGIINSQHNKPKKSNERVILKGT